MYRVSKQVHYAYNPISLTGLCQAIATVANDFGAINSSFLLKVSLNRGN